jgi:hypothetical protein
MDGNKSSKHNRWSEGRGHFLHWDFFSPMTLSKMHWKCNQTLGSFYMRNRRFIPTKAAYYFNNLITGHIYNLTLLREIKKIIHRHELVCFAFIRTRDSHRVWHIRDNANFLKTVRAASQPAQISVYVGNWLRPKDTRCACSQFGENTCLLTVFIHDFVSLHFREHVHIRFERRKVIYEYYI